MATHRSHWFSITALLALLWSLPLTVAAQGSSSQAAGDVDVRELKAKVAQATRMLVRANLLESSGHVSIRIPGTNRVLIGDRDVSRAILRAEDIITVDLDSKKIEGKGSAPRETEIHTSIYRARPDAMSVIHTHPLHSFIFSVTGKPILPISVHGAIFGDGVPVFEHVGHVDNRELGDAMARAIGGHQAVLLKMHGAAIVGPTVERAFAYALHLEENAEKQLLAEATGPVKAMTSEEVKRCLGLAFGDTSIQKIWDHHAAKEQMAGKLSH